MAANYNLLTEEALVRICHVINLFTDVTTNINDAYITEDLVWSSEKIEEELALALQDINLNTDSSVSNKVSIEQVDALPAEADMIIKRLYFVNNSNADGDYYDTYMKVDENNVYYLGNTSFYREKYYTKEEMDNRYGVATFINKNNNTSTIASKSMYDIMNQDAKAINNKYLSTHKNVYIKDYTFNSLNHLYADAISPFSAGEIRTSVRNGLAYMNIQLTRGAITLADESPSALEAWIDLSSPFNLKDEFGKYILALPEFINFDEGESFVITMLNTGNSSVMTKEADFNIRLIKRDGKYVFQFKSTTELIDGAIYAGQACYSINVQK